MNSSGAGVATGFIYNDATGSYANFGEHVNYLANLFTEYKVLRARWTFTSAVSGYSDSKSGPAGPMAVGVYLRSSSGVPTLTSMDQILDNQPSWMWNIGNDTSSSGFVRTQWFDQKINYQLVTTVSPDYAGAPGGVAYYGVNLPISQIVGYITQEVWYSYRARS